MVTPVASSLSLSDAALIVDEALAAARAEEEKGKRGAETSAF